MTGQEDSPLSGSPTSSPVKSEARLPALDGLRGIAIILVMVNHFTLYGGMLPDAFPDRVWRKATLVGWCGVDLFFVLSGFLITGILLDARRGPGYFRSFYARRMLRIFPLYYGVLAVTFWLLPLLFPQSAGLRQLGEQQAWYWTYLVNWDVALHWWPDPAIIAHFWSLAIEEQFYLVWPLLVFALARRRLAAACVFIVVGSFTLRVFLALWDEPTAAYVATPARADLLALGALLALAVRTDEIRTRLAVLAPTVLTAATAVFAGLFLWRRGFHPGDDVVNTVGFSVLGVLFAAALMHALSASPGSRFVRMLSSRPLRFFGKYSYGLYVFHQPVAILLAAHVFSVASIPRVLGIQLFGQLIFTSVAAVLSFALAAASWHLYESRVLRLKRHFPYPRAEACAPGGGSSAR